MKGRLAVRTMMHPVNVLALVVLIANDQLLKDAHPGAVSGKLSDIAGLVVFPLMVLSVIDFVAGIAPQNVRRLVSSLLIVTGVVFAGIQLVPLLGDGYRYALGALQYPFRALAGARALEPVAHTADVTDLIALPALWVAWWVAARSGKGARRSLPPSSAKATGISTEHRRASTGHSIS